MFGKSVLILVTIGVGMGGGLCCMNGRLDWREIPREIIDQRRSGARMQYMMENGREERRHAIHAGNGG